MIFFCMFCDQGRPWMQNNPRTDPRGGFAPGTAPPSLGGCACIPSSWGIPSNFATIFIPPKFLPSGVRKIKIAVIFITLLSKDCVSAVELRYLVCMYVCRLDCCTKHREQVVLEESEILHHAGQIHVPNALHIHIYRKYWYDGRQQ